MKAAVKIFRRCGGALQCRRHRVAQHGLTRQQRADRYPADVNVPPFARARCCDSNTAPRDRTKATCSKHQLIGILPRSISDADQARSGLNRLNPYATAVTESQGTSRKSVAEWHLNQGKTRPRARKHDWLRRGSVDDVVLHPASPTDVPHTRRERNLSADLHHVLRGARALGRLWLCIAFTPHHPRERRHPLACGLDTMDAHSVSKARLATAATVGPLPIRWKPT